jgi:hypothetical protein
MEIIMDGTKAMVIMVVTTEMAGATRVIMATAMVVVMERVTESINF